MASNPHTEVTARKQALRAEVRRQRALMSDEQLAAAGASVSERLQRLVLDRGVRSVSCYLSVSGEPDTREFLDWAAATGLEVLLPVSRPDGMLNWVHFGDGTLAPGAFDIPEPIGERLAPSTVSEVDLMLIPAAAVDRGGHRLGWGRGYFDRTLAHLPTHPPVFALVHDHELLERGAVPVEPHDVPLDGAVTPGLVLEF